MTNPWGEDEREAMEAKIAAREEMIQREAALQRWSEVSNSHVVTRSAPSRRWERQTAADEWRDYIDSAVKRAEQRTLTLAMEIVGEEMGKMRADLRAEFEKRLESEVLKLRNEFLQDRLDQERGTRLKLVQGI
jgi:hypothetical protein